MVCPRCGNLREECRDPAVDWIPRTSTCWASATEEWAHRRHRAKNEDKKVGDHQLHPLDGTWVWVSTVPLGEDEEDEF